MRFSIKQKWFRFGDSFINLSYVVRVFKLDPKNVTIEFKFGKASYGFDSKEDADQCLEQLWETVNK